MIAMIAAIVIPFALLSMARITTGPAPALLTRPLCHVCDSTAAVRLTDMERGYMAVGSDSIMRFSPAENDSVWLRVWFGERREDCTEPPPRPFYREFREEP